MPIVFEAPGPFLPSASIGAGQAEQYSKDLPSLIAQQRTLAGLYESMARAHAGGGGGGGVQQVAPSSGGGYGQGQILPTAPSSDPLTQSENLRLQRLQNARSLIQQQVSDGTLTNEDANNLLIQAQTGIDPLKGQQERAQAKLRDQQMQALQQQQQMATQAEQEATVFRAKSMEQRTSHIYAPDGSYIGSHIQSDPTGRGNFVPHNPATREQGLAPALINTIQHQVDQRVDAQIRHFSNPLNSAGRPAWMATEASQQAYREQEHEQAVARARTQIRREQPAAPAAATPSREPTSLSDIGTAALGRQAPTPGQLRPQAQAAAVPGQPFSRDTPASQSPEQQRAVEFFNDMRSRVDDRPEGERATLRRDVDAAMSLLERHGSPAAMPPPVLQEYERLARHLNSSLPARRTASTAQTDRLLSSYDDLRARTPEEYRSQSRFTHARELLARYGSPGDMPRAERLVYETALQYLRHNATTGGISRIGEPSA